MACYGDRFTFFLQKNLCEEMTILFIDKTKTKLKESKISEGHKGIARFHPIRWHSS
jgi:hypothetical protein